MQLEVEGFDFNKQDFVPTSPRSHGDSLPGDDLWSPGAPPMNVSPLHPPVEQNHTTQNNIHYGSLVDALAAPQLLELPQQPLQPLQPQHHESRPLLEKQQDSKPIPSTGFARSSLNSVSRSMDSTKEQGQAMIYRDRNVWARAFPGRIVTLLVTMTVEIPVLLMILGGSHRLGQILGPERYQLWMAFLPLTMALSGSCALQTSTLTTRAMESVTTTETLWSWMHTELATAAVLGVCTGAAMGLVAFVMTDRDVTFAMTILIAQTTSTFIAGFTGTVVPIVLSNIHERDPGKWRGVLETAIQDVVASFVMVILSYNLLLAFGGPSESETTGGPT
jgi:hypothetical protein